MIMFLDHIIYYHSPILISDQFLVIYFKDNLMFAIFIKKYNLFVYLSFRLKIINKYKVKTYSITSIECLIAFFSIETINI
jgi:hypothetical protein